MTQFADGVREPARRSLRNRLARAQLALGALPEDPLEALVPPEDHPGAVPFPARRAMQDAIYRECILPGDNEWTTWTDSIAVAETAAEALIRAGWKVVPVEAGQATA